MLYAGVALAAPVNEVEPNDSILQAQNIDRYFTLDSDPNITNSTTVPHATVNGTGNNTFDYYSFTVPEAGVFTIGLFDIDGAWPNFDSYLRLYDSSSNVIAANDDNAGDPGSEEVFPGFTLDSYLEYNFPSAGTYYIEVGRCCIDPVPDTVSYKLNVSVEGHAVYPQTTAECKNNGWKNFENPNGSPMFKNQGDCVSNVATLGKNEPGQNVPNTM